MTKLSAFAFPENNLDGAFIKPKFLPESIDQVTVIRKMNFFGIVGDNGKGWRLAGYLGCIKELYASTSVQRRGMRINSILEYTVQPVGGKCFTELLVN